MATTEVEATLAMVNFIQEVNVYGVSVPGEYRGLRGGRVGPKSESDDVSAM